MPKIKRQLKLDFVLQEASTWTELKRLILLYKLLDKEVCHGDHPQNLKDAIVKVIDQLILTDKLPEDVWKNA